MFLEDIDRLFNMFEKMLSESARNFDTRSFRIVQDVGFQKMRYPQIIFKNDSGFSLNYLEDLGVSKVENNWLWGPWTHPGIRKS